MGGERKKTRMLPEHVALAQKLQDHYYRHLPDAEYPSRQLIIELALRKGLRCVDRQIKDNQIPILPKTGGHANQPKPRIEIELLRFADRLRAPLHRLLLQAEAERVLGQRRTIQGGTSQPVRYPDRSVIIAAAMRAGLDKMIDTYAADQPELQRAS